MTQETLKIAIKTPLYRVFDYLPPEDLNAADLAPGTRVLVPFGRRSLVGLVWQKASPAIVEARKLRRISKVLDNEPLLDDAMMRLLWFAGDYYQHPPGEVMAAALPQLLREGRSVDEVQTWLSALPALDQDALAPLTRRAPRQAEVAQELLLAGPAGLLADALVEKNPRARQAIKALLEKSLISESKRTLSASDSPAPVTPIGGPTLGDAQRKACADIRETLGAFAVTVLDGVTGSGKTEVYLQLIETVISNGKQALVLVPEIGLTPQLLQRFEERFGVRPTLMHSGLTPAERLTAWRDARSGRASVVIGTRSAVYSPLAAPGIIIVDEEHDPSLKQQEGFRYSARDLAIARAKDQNFPVVLGSATPSLETLANISAGRYRRCELPKRVGNAMPPRLRIVDLNVHGQDDGVSGPLRLAIEKHLADDGQALLYINRRGFAPTMICSDCGEIRECSNCDARLTLHAARQRLCCHHCGEEQAVDDQCDACQGQMKALGAGSERVEKALARYFPGETVLRIDSDSTSRKGSFEQAYERARTGDAKILVGTQMLSKGHHFPKLTLVGVLNIDQGLFGTDFRASERLAQSVIQVAGRAGRETKAGEVLIQTEFPEHPLLSLLLTKGYPAFAESALSERNLTGWPPYASLALLRAQSKDRNRAWVFLSEARQLALSVLADGVSVYGPVHAVMERRAGQFRSQVLFHSRERVPLRRLLRQLRSALDDLGSRHRVRWSLDIDPIDLM